MKHAAAQQHLTPAHILALTNQYYTRKVSSGSVVSRSRSASILAGVFAFLAATRIYPGPVGNPCAFPDENNAARHNGSLFR